MHSDRLIQYLSEKSNTTKNMKKYKIIRPCSNIKPKNIIDFNNRKIDILFFEKYSDIDHRKEGQLLLSELKKFTKNIVTISYGSYNKKSMKKIANESRFIIYFSFYDTGAIGLKEFQNFGVFAFVHQKEFVINNETSFYIPELALRHNMKLASNKIIRIIKDISEKNPNSYLIAKKNQITNNCKNALLDLCNCLI